MAVTVKHKFQSQLPDSADASLVRPSNWNDNHEMTLDGTGIIGRDTNGTGVVKQIPLGTGLSFTSGALSAGSIAGRSLTVSSSAPSGGQDGDIHFQI